MKQKGVVHYVAAGLGGTCYACYIDELNAHLDSRYEITEPRPQRFEGDIQKRTITKYKTPMPYRTTDIEKTTCPYCIKMVRSVVNKRKLGEKQ